MRVWEEPPPGADGPRPQQGSKPRAPEREPVCGDSTAGLGVHSLQGPDPYRGCEVILTVTMASSGQMMGYEDILSVTLGSSSQWTGCEDVLSVTSGARGQRMGM